MISFFDLCGKETPDSEVPAQSHLEGFEEQIQTELLKTERLSQVVGVDVTDQVDEHVDRARVATFIDGTFLTRQKRILDTVPANIDEFSLQVCHNRHCFADGSTPVTMARHKPHLDGWGPQRCVCGQPTAYRMRRRFG